MNRIIKVYYFVPAIIFTLIIIFGCFVFSLMAAPPSTPYYPGETLEPTCSVGDVNCTVSSPVSTYFTTTTIITMNNYPIDFGPGILYVNSQNNHIGIGTTTPTEALEFGLNKRMKLATDQNNLDDSSLIRLQWMSNVGKPAIGWFDENGNRQAAIVAHRYLTYPSDEHKHFSIETSDSLGALQTRFEIPWGADTIEIQTHSADFKVGGAHKLIVGSDGSPGTSVLNSNTYITGNRKLGIGFVDENQSFYTTASMELYRNGYHSEFLINEAAGTKEARLHLRRGTKDWEIINNTHLTFETEDNEVMRLTNAGNLVIGATTTNARFEVAGGDAYISTQNNGLILRDTDGSGCHKITINSAGVIAAATITCP
jgi:hypothetical protein